MFGADQDSLPISSVLFSEADDKLHRPRLREVEARNLYIYLYLPPTKLPAASYGESAKENNHIIIPIIDASMLIRIRATTNTPGALVEGLTETEHGAIAEAHTPHEGRILRMRRRRPVVGRLDIQKRMAG